MVKDLSRGGILMQYKDFQGLSLSRLGMGNMRLPASAPRGPIDTDKAEELIDYVYHQGINYLTPPISTTRGSRSPSWAML